MFLQYFFDSFSNYCAGIRMGIILIRINSVFHRNLDCVPPNGDFLSIKCLDLTAPPSPLFVAWFLAGWTCHTATTIPRVLFTDVHIEEDTIGMVGGGGVGCIFFFIEHNISLASRPPVPGSILGRGAYILYSI